MTIELKNFVGKNVEIIGEISKVPWQHLINFSDSHANIQYIDLDSGDQIVVYSRSPIECKNKVKRSGEVIRVAGKSKRPGDISGSVYVEYQILVDNWECFN